MSRAAVNNTLKEAELSLFLRLRKLKRLKAQDAKDAWVLQELEELQGLSDKEIRRRVAANELDISQALSTKLETISGQDHSITDLQDQRTTSVLGILFSGGHEAWASDVMVASLDVDHDGVLNDDEIEKYIQQGEHLVGSFQDFTVNTGVVSALILSIIYPLTLEANMENFDEYYYGTGDGPLTDLEVVRVWMDVVIFVFWAVASVLSFALLIQSARLHTQISFWMPNLESKVWYAQKTSRSVMHLESMKRAVIFLTMAALILSAFKRAWFIGVVVAIPVALLLCWILSFEVWSNGQCSMQLEEQTRMVLSKSRKAQMDKTAETKQKTKARRESLRQSKAHSPSEAPIVV